MAPLLFHATLPGGRLCLRLPSPPGCTAAAAAIALDDHDDLLQGVDEWLAAELDWRWQGMETASTAVPARPEGAGTHVPTPGGAIAELAAQDNPAPAAQEPCRLELPWTLMRSAGAPPARLATRLRWQDAPARLTLARLALEHEELAAIEPGGAIVLSDSMHADWHGWLHGPGEAPEHGLALTIGHPAATAPARGPQGSTSALAEAPAGIALEVRLAIAPSLPAPLLAGWCGLDAALGDLARQQAQAWLIDAAIGRSPGRLAVGRLIPWGSGWAMLFDDVVQSGSAPKV